MSHHCHALACDVATRPEMLMCRRHWAMVPSALKRAVLETYRPGQCADKRPSATWLAAAARARSSVARQEGNVLGAAWLDGIAEMFDAKAARRAATQ